MSVSRDCTLVHLTARTTLANLLARFYDPQQGSITIDGTEQKVIAWDMTKSGIYDNFSGDHPNVCMGQTIFGLTSTTGQSDIHDINFVADPDEYANQTVNIRPTRNAPQAPAGIYQLNGMRSSSPKGIVVTKGRKFIKKKI